MNLTEFGLWFIKKVRRKSVTIYAHIHIEIFSESYQINPKSDCIYYFPIDIYYRISYHTQNLINHYIWLMSATYVALELL